MVMAGLPALALVVPSAVYLPSWVQWTHDLQQLVDVEAVFLMLYLTFLEAPSITLIT